MVKCMLLSFYYTMPKRKLQRKPALRLKHFAQWRKSARASLRNPRHYRPACILGLSSVTLRLIVTAESYISGADSIKFLSYQLPPIRQEKFSVPLSGTRKFFLAHLFSVLLNVFPSAVLPSDTQACRPESWRLPAPPSAPLDRRRRDRGLK